MVAEDEDALHVASVCGGVARKDIEPGVGDCPQFTHEAKVGDVAGEDQGVDSLLVIPAQRPGESLDAIVGDERDKVVGEQRVDVA